MDALENRWWECKPARQLSLAKVAVALKYACPSTSHPSPRNPPQGNEKVFHGSLSYNDIHWGPTREPNNEELIGLRGTDRGYRH